MSKILEISGVYKHFGGIKALNGVSLDVEDSMITGVIGPNGSGKTTLINVITGFHPFDEGDIRFAGRPLNGLRMHEISLRGLARTFQITRIFSKMTVMENMLAAPKGQSGERLFNVFFKRRSIIKEDADHRRKADEILEFLELDHLKDEYAENLSGGQKKLLELGKALMTDPEMILLDEPVAGVNSTLARRIFTRICDLREDGMSFLVVEHNMEIVMNLCNEIYVMDRGEIVAGGTASEIQNDEKVIDAYLGRCAEGTSRFPFGQRH
jgi:branched-chain amino acid transport system ATP-binding protein